MTKRVNISADPLTGACYFFEKNPDIHDLMKQVWSGKIRTFVIPAERVTPAVREHIPLIRVRRGWKLDPDGDRAGSLDKNRGWERVR